MPELNLILLGPPGSGKGTQGKTLQEDFHLPYYATGDILRAAVKEGTEVGRRAKEYMDRGDLVPDEVIIEVIGERVQQEEARDGFILDGFPRTVPQAEALDEEMEDLGRRITAAILIDVPEEEIIRRLSGRRTCEAQGHIFHVEFDPPKEDGVCDIDGSRLIVRDDDKPEVIRHRLEQLQGEDRAADRLLRRPGDPLPCRWQSAPRGGERADPRPARHPPDGRRNLGG